MNALRWETEQLSEGPSIRVVRAKPILTVAAERSGRTMNHMDPQTKAVHLRLERWGRAVREAIDHGWPIATMLARLIEQGPMGASQDGRPPTSMSDEDAATDAAVAKLCQIDQRVVVDYYTHWIGLEILARRHKMRVRQAQNVLRRARWRVGGYLLATGGV